MIRLLQIAREELRSLASDRGALLVLVGGTLFYGFFYPLPYRAQVAQNLPVVVTDFDRSATSRQLIRMLDATEAITVSGVLGERAAGELQLRAGEVAGWVEIPSGFQRDLLRGRPAAVGLWADAARLVVYSEIAAGVSGAAGTLGAAMTVRRLEQAGTPPPTALARAQPLRLDLRELFNPGGGYGTYVVPAVLVLILQQTVLIAVGMVGVDQRGHRPGTTTALEAVAGRVLAYLPIQLLLALVFLGLVYGVYEFPRRASMALGMLVLLPFFVATTALGLLLGQLFRSRETVLQILMLASAPMLFLAGFAWPAEALPPALLGLGRLFPSTAGIDAFIRVHQMGASLAEVRASWLSLWGLALAYLALATALGRRRSSTDGWPRPQAGAAKNSGTASASSGRLNR
jgi:ABC-2 type transport system permease protein